MAAEKMTSISLRRTNIREQSASQASVRESLHDGTRGRTSVFIAVPPSTATRTSRIYCDNPRDSERDFPGIIGAFHPADHVGWIARGKFGLDPPGRTSGGRHDVNIPYIERCPAYAHPIRHLRSVGRKPGRRPSAAMSLASPPNAEINVNPRALLSLGTERDLAAVGRNMGSWSSAESVVNLIASPPVTCRTQMSRFSSPLRSEAKANSLPSGERAGSVVRPESDVSRVSIGPRIVGGGRVTATRCRNRRR